MKLEVGMYCRWGLIDDKLIQINRIIDIFNQNNKAMYFLDNGGLVFKEEIIKASHNIIDLIEVGDYVNGEEVTYVTQNNYIETMYGEILTSYHNDDIKTILTHEQMENIVIR